MKLLSKYVIRVGQTLLWLYSKFLTTVILRVTIDKPPLEFTKHTGVLIISSHVSLFDPSILVGSLSWKEFRLVYPIRAMLAKWYFHSLILPIAYAIGCFPARPLFPQLKKYSGTSAAASILKNDESLGIYPEGQRTPKKRIPAKYGVVKILQNAPENQPIYLCKMTKHTWRKYSLVLKRMDTIRNYTDPDKIMDEVYKLTDTI